MRELRIQVPGYVGPEVAFTTQADAWAAFPPGEFPAVARQARAWLVPGLPAEYGTPDLPHVLVVEAGP